MQIFNSLPTQWKETIKQDNGNSNNLIIQDHHLIKNHQILCLEKLESKELYIIQLSTPSIKPTSQRYFENLFERIDFDWANIYVMPRLLTLDSRLRAFQYKILHNVLYLNKQLFKFQKVNSPLCSFCNQKEETAIHIFQACPITKVLWVQLISLVENKLSIPTITPQSAIFGFLQNSGKDHIIINHLLLIFKFYVYVSRDQHKVSFNVFKSKIKNIKKTEKTLAMNDSKKLSKFNKKWRIIEDILE